MTTDVNVFPYLLFGGSVLFGSVKLLLNKWERQRDIEVCPNQKKISSEDRNYDCLIVGAGKILISFCYDFIIISYFYFS